MRCRCSATTPISKRFSQLLFGWKICL